MWDFETGGHLKQVGFWNKWDALVLGTDVRRPPRYTNSSPCVFLGSSAQDRHVTVGTFSNEPLFLKAPVRLTWVLTSVLITKNDARRRFRGV